MRRELTCVDKTQCDLRTAEINPQVAGFAAPLCCNGMFGRRIAVGVPDRVQQDSFDPFADLIPRYDFILTYGGGQPVVNAYKQLGAQECVPIYNALDPSTHFPAAPDPRFEADLSFLGNRLPDRTGDGRALD